MVKKDSLVAKKELRELADKREEQKKNIRRRNK